MSEDLKTEDEMSEDERNALQADEDFILNFKQEDYDDPEKAKKLDEALANAKTTIHQKRHYRERYQELKGKTPPENKKPEEVKAPATGEFEIAKADQIEFRQDHPELPKEVIKEIVEYATAMRITLDAAMEKETIKTLVRSKRDRAEIEDAGLHPQRKASGGVAEKDWSNATQQEIAAERAKMGY